MSKMKVYRIRLASTRGPTYRVSKNDTHRARSPNDRTLGRVNRKSVMPSFLVEFSANINVCSGSIHSTASDETAFDELVRVASKNFAILASSRLSFVSVDYEVPWSILEY